MTRLQVPPRPPEKGSDAKASEPFFNEINPDGFVKCPSGVKYAFGV